MGCCSSPSPPPAPDPVQTANAQTNSNRDTALFNAALNRTNQTTPWGSITYNQGAPDANGIPQWSSNIQLSPEQQRLLTQQQNLQMGKGDIAQQLLGRVGDRLGQPLDLSNLHGINDRGSMYRGAINSAVAQGNPMFGGNAMGAQAAGARMMGLPNAPSGNPMLQSNALTPEDKERMMRAYSGAAGQIGNSAASGISGAMGAAGGPLMQLMQALASNPQLAQKLQQMMGGQGMPQGQMPPQQPPSPQGLGGSMGELMGGAPQQLESRQQGLANLLRGQ